MKATISLHMYLPSTATAEVELLGLVAVYNSEKESSVQLNNVYILKWGVYTTAVLVAVYHTDPV